MGREQNQERQPSVFCGICTVFYFILVDIILYGVLIPLIGTYLAGCVSNAFGMTPKMELISTVLLTFTLIYGTFCLVGEARYWKHLFAFDSFYCVLLQIRDVINGIMFMVCLFGLASTVEAMVNQDKGMKQNYVSEGTSYVFIKNILEFFNIDPEPVLAYIGFGPPHKGTITDPSFGENEKFEHGAAYMLLWAILTACVAKLIYYNTLFTYLRAMEIFMSMKPTFDDDDDTYEDSRFSFVTKAGRTPSRLENDFANSVKRTTI